MTDRLVNSAELPLPPIDLGEGVTARGLVVLQLLARGYTDGQIAALLACTPGQVDALVTSSAEQLGVTTRYEAVASAVQRGLIH